MDNFPGKIEKSPSKGHAYVLNDEQKAWLCKWFPTIENARLCKYSGMSLSTLHKFARNLELSKSERGMRAIKKRQAAHIKRLCERNGYYDSLRSTAPSEQCIRANKRMWQEICEGKREHPIKILEKCNPRRYKNFKKQKKESRKELIRKEKLRGIYGLERRSKLYLPVVAYTKRQTSHRHNALKRGYFYADVRDEHSPERFIIYYDDETKRSKRFEENLVADGFTVKRDD